MESSEKIGRSNINFIRKSLYSENVLVKKLFKVEFLKLLKERYFLKFMVYLMDTQVENNNIL